MEHHRRDRDVLPHAGQNLAHGHAPGAVSGVGDGGALGRGHLGADDGGQRVAAVAEAHRREEAARPLEAQVAVGHRVDVADVGGHHGVFGHGLFQFPEHLARVQQMRVLLDHLQAEFVLLVNPLIQLFLPGVLLRLDLGGAGLAVL